MVDVIEQQPGNEMQLEKERLNKEGVRYPGGIKLANQRGHMPGVLCKGFEGGTAQEVADAINAFAAQDKQLLLVAEPVLTSDGVDVHAITFWGKTLTTQEMTWMEDFQKAWQTFKDTKQKEIQDAQDEVQARIDAENAKAKADFEAKQKELEELAALGRQCRNNHKGKK
jgi:hypothetical protein